MFEAVKVALDPTPSQERRLLSHAGAARFAYNAGLARVKAALDAGEVLDWSFFALVNWWDSCKDELAVGGGGEPWCPENSKEAYSYGVRSLASALSNWSKSGAVGVDLGVKHLAALSDGTVIENPRYLKKSEGKLKRAQQALSRKAKGSNRRAKARVKVAHLHARVANQRSDAMHKLTTRLAWEYSDISIEDLHVAGMVKNHHLAKSVSDAAFGEFRRQLEYKTTRSGARLHVVDRWYRSSKTCSCCGRVKAKLSLSERTYHCDSCGLTMDRDLNAAINICVAGSAPETLNAHGETVKRNSPSGCATWASVKCEPGVRGGRRAVSLGAGDRNGALQATVR